MGACQEEIWGEKRHNGEGVQEYERWKRLWYSEHKEDPYNTDRMYSFQKYRMWKKLQDSECKDDP